MNEQNMAHRALQENAAEELLLEAEEFEENVVSELTTTELLKVVAKRIALNANRSGRRYDLQVTRHKWMLDDLSGKADKAVKIVDEAARSFTDVMGGNDE